MAGCRVAFLINSMQGGGAERVAQLMIDEAARRGDSEVVLLLMLSDKVTLPVAPSVRIMSRRKAPDSGVGKALALLPQALWLKRIARQEGIDTVVSFLERSNLANALSRWLGARHRVVVTEHTNPRQTYAGRGLGAFSMRWLIRRLYGQADAILAVSHGVKECLVEGFAVPRSLISVVHNPCDLQRIEMLAREPARLPWEIDDVPIICNVGRLAEPKGHAQLLRAFAILLDTMQARLLLIGEGPLEKHLRSVAARLGIERAVAFVGWQDNPYKYLARTTLFASSSLWEGFGIAILEALACGVPVVAYDCESGPREVLQGGRCGVLVPVGDERRLAAEMTALLRDRERCSKLAALGRERASDFGLQAAYSAYEQAWLGP